MATALIQFTPGDNFASGTLYARRLDTMATTSQAVVSGTNSVTVTAGVQYAFWIVSLNAAGEVSPEIAGPVIMTIPDTTAGTDFLIRWKTDYDSDFIETGFGASESRVRIPMNRRGHNMQWEIKSDAQNQRFELRNAALTVRLHGEAMNARQS